MAIIRPGSFSYPRQWNPTQVPTWPVEIDYSHPLARGIRGLWLLNSPDCKNLVGVGPNPIQASISPGGIITSPIGPVMSCSGNNIPTNDGGAFSPGTGDFTIGGFLSLGTSSIIVAMGEGSGAASSYWLGATSANIQFSLGPTNLTTGSYGDGKLHHVVASRIAGTAYLYVDGVIQATLASTDNLSETTDFVIAKFGTALAYNWVGNLSGIFNYRIGQTSSNAAWLAAEPFAMLRPVVRRSYFVAAAGGTVYSASISETAVTSDALLSAAVFASAISDTGALSDQFASAASFASALTDSASSSDNLTATAIFLASLADAAASSDTLTSAGVFPAAFADSAASSDVLSSAAIFQASFADVSATSDLLTAISIFGASYGDIATTSDLFSGSGVFLASMSDVAVVSDAFTIPATGGLIGYPTPSGRILGLQPASRSSFVTASSRSVAVVTSPRRTS